MKQYPLVFTSERARNRYHTQDAESPWMLEIEPEPIVRLNPRDAAPRGLAEGDYVDVFNTRGLVDRPSYFVRGGASRHGGVPEGLADRISSPRGLVAGAICTTANLTRWG